LSVSFLPFSTPRLTVNRFALADAAALAMYRSDPETARFQGWTAPYAIGAAEALIAGQLDRTGPSSGEWLQIALRRDGVLVGDVAVGMSTDGRVADIGYTIAPAFRGQRLAAEAIDALVDRLFALTAVERLRASVDPRNRPSLRVLEQVGFVYRGSDDAPCLDPDAVVDDDVYTIDRDTRAAWVGRVLTTPAQVRLVDITPDNARAVRRLVVHGSQRHLVTAVTRSFADAHVPEVYEGAPVVPWHRAIEADGQLAGFVMLAEQTEAHSEPCLWRLLIDRSHQRRGIGEQVVALIVDRLRTLGQTSLVTSWVPGSGSPEPFYRRLGFVPTGRIEDDEIEARLML
jgi:RimJ/RimL family protein N-acetyltransferase